MFEEISSIFIEINTEKTKNVFMSHHQNSGKNYNIKVTNKSLENMVNFRYCGMT